MKSVKLSIESVKQAFLDALGNEDEVAYQKFCEELDKKLDEAQEEEAAKKASKEEKPSKEWFILTSKEGDQLNYLIQLGENVDGKTVMEDDVASAIEGAIAEFVQTKRFAKTGLSESDLLDGDVGKILEQVPSKHFKTQGIFVKCKTPVKIVKY